jgi:hypothetical protein
MCLPFLLDEIGGLLDFYVPGSLLETKSILNGGMSNNCLGIPGKFYFFTFILANFKLSIKVCNFIIQLRDSRNMIIASINIKIFASITNRNML